MEQVFNVTVLGSGSAIPTTHRNPAAQVVNHAGKLFLIDCGEGTQIQVRRNNLNFSRLSHIFISHLHGDHFYGLIGLISTFNLLGLKKDIHIYSDSGLKELIQPMLDHLKGQLLFKVIFHPLNFRKRQVVYTDKNLQVISFPLKHSVPTCGFLFQEIPRPLNIRKEQIDYYNIPLSKIREIKSGLDYVTEEGKIIPNHSLTIVPARPRSYAYCSDTAFDESIAENIKDVDVLFHEATFTDEMEAWAVKTLHSTATQAATLAKLAGAKKLLIGHFSSRYKDSDPFLKQARAVFNECYAVSESEVYEI